MPTTIVYAPRQSAFERDLSSATPFLMIELFLLAVVLLSGGHGSSIGEQLLW
jgi:hypothetical protein